MRIEFHPEARAEFLGAVEYYESCQLGLGGRFVQSIEAAIAKVHEHPEAWGEIEEDVRRDEEPAIAARR
jgi:hypothetical protein